MLQEGNFYYLKGGGRSILFTVTFWLLGTLLVTVISRAPHLQQHLECSRFLTELLEPSYKKLMCLITVYGAGAERRSGGIPQVTRSSLPLNPTYLVQNRQRYAQKGVVRTACLYWGEFIERIQRNLMEGKYRKYTRPCGIWEIARQLFSLFLSRVTLSLVCAFYLLVYPFRDKGQGPES